MRQFVKRGRRIIGITAAVLLCLLLFGCTGDSAAVKPTTKPAAGVEIELAAVPRSDAPEDSAEVYSLVCLDPADSEAAGGRIRLQKGREYILKASNATAENAEILLHYIDGTLRAAPAHAAPERTGETAEVLIDRTSIAISLKSGAAASVSLTAVEDTAVFDGITVFAAGGHTCYAGSGAYLAEILGSRGLSNAYIILTEDITIAQDLVIGIPCGLSLHGRNLTISGMLLFQTDLEGTLAIHNTEGQLTAEAFYAEAPACGILTERDFFDFAGRHDYYLQVLAYNEIAIDPLAVTVCTEEELYRLADPEQLPHVSAGMTVTLEGDFTLTQEAVFRVPLSLRVTGTLNAEFPILVETRENGAISISAARESGVEPGDFMVDAPFCTLTYDGAGAPDLVAAAELMNVCTYNGTDLHDYGLGGSGRGKILSFGMRPEENSALEEPLYWTVRGNVLYLAVSYLTDDQTLRQAIPFVEASEGTVRFSKQAENGSVDLLADGYCTVTDAQGGTRKYWVRTERITYHLPVIYINIENRAEVVSQEEYLRAVISIDSATAAGGFESLQETAVHIRGRGHYSWNFDKKPYKLRFDEKTSVLGMNASKNWVLLANYNDRSLIQSYLAMEMGKVMTHIPYHTTQYPVDVFVNGAYQGVYTIGEQLEVKPERIVMEENYDDPDTDYLLEVGGTDTGDVYLRDYFHAGTLRHIAIKHPDSAKLTVEKTKFLRDYVAAADAAVKKLTDYDSYIDVDSLIDWVIMHELTYNLDCCFRRSCYLIKEKGGKLKMGPIWDFDLAFGSFRRYKENTWATVGSEDGYVGITWMNYLFEDPIFVERFNRRWDEMKAPLMEKAMTCIDEMTVLIWPSQEMNFRVWDLLGKSMASQPDSYMQYDTYELQIKRLKDYLNARYAWMDRTIDEMAGA